MLKERAQQSSQQHNDGVVEEKSGIRHGKVLDSQKKALD